MTTGAQKSMQNFEHIRRIFLDTCVVNFIFDYGEQIHDGVPLPTGLTKDEIDDINALYNIFLTGQRTAWQFAISPFTYFEIEQTKDGQRRIELQNWFNEIWHHWRETIKCYDDFPSFIESEDLRIKVLGSGCLDDLPDYPDRFLLVDAVVYRCDCFCTRDKSTIIKHRSGLNGLALPVLTPKELWERIIPYAKLIASF